MEAVTAGASGGLGSLAGAAASFAGGGGGDGLSPGLSGGTISPEFVDSLSKRLTTAEMKGIIQLTERGRRLEDRASTLQAEKEDLFARLQVMSGPCCSAVLLKGSLLHFVPYVVRYGGLKGLA